MKDPEKVIKGIESCLNQGYCVDNFCPYETHENCIDVLLKDALELIKDLKHVIDQYHKADGFLSAHGWKWSDENG